MANARQTQWRFARISDESTAVGFPGTIWGAGSDNLGMNIATSESILRTRLQAHFTFGVKQAGTTPPDLPLLWYQGMRLNLGLYANKNGPITAHPPAVTTADSDGNWIMNEMLTPHQVNYFHRTASTFDHQEVVFKYDSGTLDVQSKRGPWTVNGGMWLAWAFLSSVNFWILNSATQQGYMGGAVTYASLIEF